MTQTTLRARTSTAHGSPPALTRFLGAWDLLVRVYLVVAFAFFPVSGVLRGGSLPKAVVGSAVAIAVVDCVLRWARVRVGTPELLLLAFGMWYVLAVAASPYPTMAKPTMITVFGWPLVILGMAQVLVTDQRTMSAISGYVLGSLGAGVWGLVNVATGLKPTVQIEGTDVNDLGFYTSTAAVIAITVWASRGLRRSVRVGFGLAGLVLVVAVAASLSRGSVAGLALGLVVVFVTSRQVRPAFTAGAVVAAVAAFLLSPIWMTAVAGSLKMKQHVAGENVSSRLDAWGLGANLGVDHPLAGVGPSTIAAYIVQAEHTAPGAFVVHVAHNTFIEALYGTGVVGLALLCAGVYATFRVARRATARSGGRAVLDGRPGAPMLGALFAGLACSLFTTQTFNPTMWLVLALANAGAAPALPTGLLPSLPQRRHRARLARSPGLRRRTATEPRL